MLLEILSSSIRGLDRLKPRYRSAILPNPFFSEEEASRDSQRLSSILLRNSQRFEEVGRLSPWYNSFILSLFSPNLTIHL